MMNTFTITKQIALLFIIVFVTSCVQDDDFETPDTTVAIPEINGTLITIDALRNLLLQEQTNNGNAVLSFTETDHFISGYVISNDEGGNFFEELILQDATANPTAGVKVLLDVNPLFTTYEFGRKVFVKLEGLAVGLDSGVLSLGIANGNSLEKIAESQLDNTVMRDTLVAPITPVPIKITNFSDEKTNLYIQLEEVQFSSNDVVFNQKTYAAETTDEFDGERNLQDCSTGLSAVFSTSTFADFKALLLPAGQGSIDGILTKNFFGEVFNVVVNNPTTMFMDNERCELCGIAEGQLTAVVFEDDFETESSGSPISGNGWTNFNEEGTEFWEAYDDSNSLGISARAGSFNSGDDSTISWLITPEVNFNAQDGETLNFQTSNSFADESYLLLLYSQDWDGQTSTISRATWLPILDANIVGDDVFFGDWVESGNVDLSCLTGTAHIAFKYVGSGDPNFDGTFELDEVVINSD